MPIHEYTVWILGAGFSKSLGGPLLVDLFRQQAQSDLEGELGRAASIEVTWVQSLFNFGKETEHLWADAEDFLAFVESAYGTISPNRQKRAHLDGLMGRAIYMKGPDWKDGRTLGMFDYAEKPLHVVLRALAIETSSFLNQAETADEQWKPYTEWAKTLNPERDTVITFNYDTVLEKLGAGLQIVLPGESIDSKRVPVFKLHGSGDWAVDPTTNKITQDADAIKKGLRIAIAAPGRSKARATSSLFEQLWKAAIKRLELAYSVAVVGYGFPKTDAEARMKLLAALDSDTTPTRRVELVLGPEIERSDVRRVFELVRRRLGRKPTYENTWPNVSVGPPNPHHSMLTQHRLWAEDFIGDYSRRTERPLS